MLSIILKTFDTKKYLFSTKILYLVLASGTIYIKGGVYMSNIQVITDSTAYITKEYSKKNHIEVVPLSVEFEGVVKSEGYPGEFEDFYNKLKTSRDFPKTSQPSAGAFVEVYNRALSSGKEIITIVLSSKLSGTFNSASLAAEIVGTDKVTVIDSETTAANLRILVERAKELGQKGLNRNEIVEIIEREKKHTGINLTVDTLDYLKKGGRLSSSQAFIGSLLNIKPIIALIDGVLVPKEKIRGKSKAMEAIINNIPENAKKISVCHILNIEEAEVLKIMLEKKHSEAIVTIDELGPVIGSHLGPKGMGVCYSL